MGSPLFDINILSEEEKKAAKSGAVSIQSIIDNAIGKRKQTLDFVFGSIKENTTVHFSTGAEWSMIELLMYLLEQSGPADVIMSTFEISEYPARLIQQLIECGSITSFKCLLDYRSKERKEGVFHLVKNIAVQIKSIPCHAKVTVIRNDSWNIVVVGSANYTRNIRIEAGVIDTNPEAVLFHYRWMMEELNNEQPFGYEFVGRTKEMD